VNRRADVVPKTRERQVRGSGTAADRLVAFDDEDRAPGLRERDRSSEAVRPGADNDGV
jgi:hypothetical protein